MSFPFSEHPDDAGRDVSVPAPDIAPGSTIEVQAVYGPGKVMVSFLTPGSSYEVSLGMDTLAAFIAALNDQLCTAAEFYDPEEGVFVDAPLLDSLPDVEEFDTPLTVDSQSGPVAVHASPQQTLRGQELPLHSEPIYRAGATPWTPRPCADPPHKGRVA